jgi:hypothetical protein
MSAQHRAEQTSARQQITGRLNGSFLRKVSARSRCFSVHG